MSTKTDIKNLNFEDALAELESIVTKLETGQAKLEDSIEIYERGADLQKHCEKRLEDAKLKIENITGKEGTGTEPFEA